MQQQTYYLGFDARRVNHWTAALVEPATLVLEDRAEAIRLAKQDGWMIVFAFRGPSPDDLILENMKPVLKSDRYEQSLHG